MNVIMLSWCILFLFGSCTNADQNQDSLQEITITESPSEKSNIPQAQVVSVNVNGSSQNYTFSVGVASPDTGCEQYADWWEVITEDGSLVYRRILAHSHVTEQPFVRSGGVVAVSENQQLIVRAHMNTLGYGTTVFKGSVKDGFKSKTIASDFAVALENQAPLPENCAF